MHINDYARQPVPQSKTVNGWRIGLIYIGVGLALPAFLVGGTLAQNAGLVDGLLVTALAGFILAVVGVLTGWVGASARLSTYMIVRRTFGHKGAYFINALLTATVFGWFAVTLSMFSAAMDAFMPFTHASRLVWGSLGGFIMVFTAVWGFKGLDRLSLIAVPLMFCALGWMAIEAFGAVGFDGLVATAGSAEIGFGVLVSMLVGAWMVGACILPDLSRYATSPGQGSLGGLLAFLPGLLGIMTLCMVPYLAFEGAGFVTIMMQVMPAFVVAGIVVLLAWSSNDNNLYAASLGLASIIPTLPKWLITIVAGGVGTFLGIMGAMDNFTGFLVILGIGVPPVAGAYLADFAMNKTIYLQTKEVTPHWRTVPMLGWVLGSLTAYGATPVHVGGGGIAELSGIAALDGLIVSAVSVLALTKLAQRRA